MGHWDLVYMENRREFIMAIDAFIKFIRLILVFLLIPVPTRLTQRLVGPANAFYLHHRLPMIGDGSVDLTQMNWGWLPIDSLWPRILLDQQLMQAIPDHCHEFEFDQILWIARNHRESSHLVLGDQMCLLNIQHWYGLNLEIYERDFPELSILSISDLKQVPVEVVLTGLKRIKFMFPSTGVKCRFFHQLIESFFDISSIADHPESFKLFDLACFSTKDLNNGRLGDALQPALGNNRFSSQRLAVYEITDKKAETLIVGWSMMVEGVVECLLAHRQFFQGDGAYEVKRLVKNSVREWKLMIKHIGELDVSAELKRFLSSRVSPRLRRIIENIQDERFKEDCWVLLGTDPESSFSLTERLAWINKIYSDEDDLEMLLMKRNVMYLRFKADASDEPFKEFYELLKIFPLASFEQLRILRILGSINVEYNTMVVKRLVEMYVYGIVCDACVFKFLHELGPDFLSCEIVKERFVSKLLRMLIMNSIEDDGEHAESRPLSVPNVLNTRWTSLELASSVTVTEMLVTADIEKFARHDLRIQLENDAAVDQGRPQLNWLLDLMRALEQIGAVIRTTHMSNTTVIPQIFLNQRWWAFIGLIHGKMIQKGMRAPWILSPELFGDSMPPMRLLYTEVFGTLEKLIRNDDEPNSIQAFNELGFKNLKQLGRYTADEIEINASDYFCDRICFNEPGHKVKSVADIVRYTGELEKKLSESFRAGLDAYSIGLSYFVNDKLIKDIGFTAHDYQDILAGLLKPEELAIHDLLKHLSYPTVSRDVAVIIGGPVKTFFEQILLADSAIDPIKFLIFTTGQASTMHGSLVINVNFYCVDYPRLPHASTCSRALFIPIRKNSGSIDVIFSQVKHGLVLALEDYSEFGLV